MPTPARIPTPSKPESFAPTDFFPVVDLFSGIGNTVNAAIALPALAIKVVALCELHPELLSFLRSRFGDTVSMQCMGREGGGWELGPAELPLVDTLFHDDVVTLVSVQLPSRFIDRVPSLPTLVNGKRIWCFRAQG